MARVARKVRDKRLLALIGRYLRAGFLVGESIQATVIGTPQGGPLSPLLANILLDDLDKELERRGRRFVRYADDLLILVKTPRAGERVMASVTRSLTRKLKLVVNAHERRVARINDCVFLGFTFRGTKLRWSERAFEDFRHQIRKLTGRSWGVSMEYRLDKLAQYVRGWMGYFGIRDLVREIEQDSGIDVGFAEGRSTLLVDDSHDPRSARDRLLALVRGIGASEYQWIDADELRASLPGISRAFVGGLSKPEFQIEPYRYTLALAQAAEKRGVEIRHGEVVGFGTRGDRVTSVRLASGDELGAELFAAGAFGRRLF